jgi:hypothetical protein
MNIIKEYVERYFEDLKNREMSYTELASIILEEEHTGLSHRTIRYKVSDYFKELYQKEEYNSFKGKPIRHGKPVVWSNLGNNTEPNKPGVNDDMFEVKFKGFDWDIDKPKTQKWVVIGCLHLPFHHKDAWNAALNLISDIRPTGFIGNGDMSDMHSISRHNKGRITIPGLTLEEEYRLSNIEIDRLDQALGNVEKHWLYGNHEMWYYDYMANSDNHKLGQGVVKSPMEALRLKERGYQVQTNYKVAHVIIGDSEVHHGTYVNKHAANKHAESMRRSNIFNHTHRTGSYLESNIFSYNIGWMGDKTAPVFGYMDRIQKETWTTGLAVVTVDECNISHVEQVTWKNNRFVYGGKMYK